MAAMTVEFRAEVERRAGVGRTDTRDRRVRSGAGVRPVSVAPSRRPAGVGQVAVQARACSVAVPVRTVRWRLNERGMALVMGLLTALVLSGLGVVVATLWQASNPM